MGSISLKNSSQRKRIWTEQRILGERGGWSRTGPGIFEEKEGGLWGGDRKLLGARENHWINI